MSARQAFPLVRRRGTHSTARPLERSPQFLYQLQQVLRLHLELPTSAFCQRGKTRSSKSGTERLFFRRTAARGIAPAEHRRVVAFVSLFARDLVPLDRRFRRLMDRGWTG